MSTVLRLSDNSKGLIAPTAHMLLLRGAGEMNGGHVERWSGIGGDGESLDGLTGDLSDDLKVLIEM